MGPKRDRHEMGRPQLGLTPNGTLGPEMGWARNGKGTKWDIRAPNGMGPKWDGPEMARPEMARPKMAGPKWVGPKWPGLKWDRPEKEDKMDENEKMENLRNRPIQIKNPVKLNKKSVKLLPIVLTPLLGTLE